MASISSTDAKPKGWARWRAIAMGTFKRFFDRDTSPRCAGTAFFGFLSFFPGFATIVLIYGLVADTSLRASTAGSLVYILPDTAMTIIGEQLRLLSEQPPMTLGLGLLISVPLTLWSGSRGVDALLFAMSQVRNQPERRGFIKSVLVAVGLTVGGAVFVVAALLTVAGLPALIPFPSGDEVYVLMLRWPILLIVTIGVFAVLYRWGPDRRPRRFRHIWPGAVVASILWLLAGAIFSIYVENWGNFDLTFGSVSAAVVLLLWMYNSAQILVFGAAFNAELERAETGLPPPA
jgi:membrane protein